MRAGGRRDRDRLRETRESRERRDRHDMREIKKPSVNSLVNCVAPARSRLLRFGCLRLERRDSVKNVFSHFGFSVPCVRRHPTSSKAVASTLARCTHTQTRTDTLTLWYALEGYIQEFIHTDTQKAPSRARAEHFLLPTKHRTPSTCASPHDSTCIRHAIWLPKQAQGRTSVPCVQSSPIFVERTAEHAAQCAQRRRPSPSHVGALA